MAKIKIPFNNTDYSIDESALASAKDSLKTHLSTVMNGSGGGDGGGTLDLSVGSTVTFKESFVDLSEGVDPPKDDTLVLYSDSTGDQSYEFVLITVGGGVAIIGGERSDTADMYVYVDDISALSVGADFGITDSGWHCVYYADGSVVHSAPPSITIKSDKAKHELFDILAPYLFEAPSTAGNTTITLDGVSYSVDPTKLSTVTDGFVAHIGTLAGGEGGGLEPITWDGVVGDRPSFIFTGMPIELNYVKISDKVLSAEECIGCTITDNKGESWTLSESDVMSGNGAVIMNMMAFSFSDAETMANEPSVVVPDGTELEAGTYVSYTNENKYMQTITLAGGSTSGNTIITINGTEYPVDFAKLSDAIADLHEALGRLQSGV